MNISNQQSSPVRISTQQETQGQTTGVNQESLVRSLYEQELGRQLGASEGDEGALDYWTSQLESGALTPTTLRQAIETSPEGVLYDQYQGLFGRAPDEEGRQYWTEQLGSGAIAAEDLEKTFLQSPEFLGTVGEVKSKTPLQAMTGAIDTGSTADLGSLFYWSRQNNKPVPPELIEQIGYSRSTDKDTAYNFTVGAQAYSEGLEALDQAIQAGDEAKAAELRDALANENTFWSYYTENLQDEEGQAHVNLRKQTASGNVFGIGDPGEYQQSFFDQIGDAISDVAENPFVQAAVTFVNPAAGSVLNAYATLDSGEELSAQQIVAAATGAADLANLPTGTAILDQLPKGIRDFAQSVQDFTEGKIDNAVAALKRAFPDVDTEKLAGYEDALKETLAGGEDFIRDVVGDENIEAISGGIAGIEDAARDLFEGQFGDLEGRLGGLEEMLAQLAQERGGSGFTPQRGYQPGLAVNTEFDQPERSAVLDILNQPSSVRRA